MWILLFFGVQMIDCERAFSGQYLYESRMGIYHCVQCDQCLFRSEDKYDSGSGWPSFKQAFETKSVYYLEDWQLVFKRYQVLCRECNGHLGHVFHDGPPPKHLRYCINSCALILKDE